MNTLTSADLERALEQLEALAPAQLERVIHTYLLDFTPSGRLVLATAESLRGCA